MNVAAPSSGTPAPAPGAAPAVNAPAIETPAAGVVTAPWSNDTIYNIGEGENAKPWWTAIQEEPVRQLMETKQYKNPAEVAMAYHNANKMINMQPEVQAFIEGKATPEQEASVYTKLGRPESADKYELTVPEGVPTTPEIQALGKEIMFDLGANPQKAAKAFEKWNDAVGKMTEAAAAAEIQKNEAALTALETKWGSELEANKAAGLRVMNALGLDAAVIDAASASMGTAAVVELLATIGRKTDEGTFKGSGTVTDPNNPATMNKDQASAKITELQGDATFQAKYTNSTHPEHKQAVALMEQLFAKVG